MSEQSTHAAVCRGMQGRRPCCSVVQGCHSTMPDQHLHVLHVRQVAYAAAAACSSVCKVVLGQVHSLPRATCRHAALAACSGWRLSRLVLEGAVPITGSTAEAVSTCCPHVTSLTLDHERHGGPLKRYVPYPSYASMEYQYGCIELLSHCGPRLTHLRLWVMDRWPALLYKYVERCTALTSLEVAARRHGAYCIENRGGYRGPGECMRNA